MRARLVAWYDKWAVRYWLVRLSLVPYKAGAHDLVPTADLPGWKTIADLEIVQPCQMPAASLMAIDFEECRVVYDEEGQALRVTIGEEGTALIGLYFGPAAGGLDRHCDCGGLMVRQVWMWERAGQHVDGLTAICDHCEALFWFEDHGPLHVDDDGY